MRIKHRARRLALLGRPNVTKALQPTFARRRNADREMRRCLTDRHPVLSPATTLPQIQTVRLSHRSLRSSPDRSDHASTPTGIPRLPFQGKCSGEQDPELAVEDGQHVFEIVAMGELAAGRCRPCRRPGPRPAPWRWRTPAAPPCGGRWRRSPCQAGSRWRRGRRHSSRRPSCCRDSASGSVPAVRRKTIRRRALLVGQTVQIAHRLTELLQMADGFAKPSVGAMNRRPKLELVILLLFSGAQRVRLRCFSRSRRCRPPGRHEALVEALGHMGRRRRRRGCGGGDGHGRLSASTTARNARRRARPIRRPWRRSDRTTPRLAPSWTSRPRARPHPITRWPPSRPLSCSTSRTSRSPRSRRCRPSCRPSCPTSRW